MNYDLEFFAKAESLDFTGTQFFMQIQFLDQDASDGGGVKGDTLLSMLTDFSDPISLSYQRFALSNIDVPDGADSFQLSFQLPAGAVANISNGLFVDDVSLTAISAVPEPGSMVALMLVSTGLIMRRRKR
ncbi:MAG: PEP-CTERM sorting domain-containing protein [Planctomycetota bacterium]